MFNPVSRTRLVTCTFGIPALNGAQDAPPSVEAHTPWSPPTKIRWLPERASTASEYVGTFGRLPLMSAQFAPASTVLKTWPPPNTPREA